MSPAWLTAQLEAQLCSLIVRSLLLSSLSEAEMARSTAPINFETKFDHGDAKTARAQKWDTWSLAFINAAASAHPFLTEQLPVRPNPAQQDPAYGLPWPSLWFDFSDDAAWRTSGQRFAVSQAQIYAILQKNFGAVEKKILDDCSMTALKLRYMAEYQLDADSEMITLLPYGILAFHAIADKYSEKGVTDALTKLARFEDAKAFNPKDVEKWASTLDSAWSEVKNAAHDPDHIAALQALMRVLNCGHHDWKTWATQFAMQQGDTPYTVTDLTTKVLAQHKILNKASPAQTGDALFGDGTQNQRSRKSKPKSGRGSPKPKCSTPGCTNTPSRGRHGRTFEQCFECHKKKEGTATVPAKTRKANQEKRIAKLKKQLAAAQRRNTEQQEEEAHSVEVEEAHVVEVGHVSPSTADDDTHSALSATVEPQSATKKKKKKTTKAKLLKDCALPSRSAVLCKPKSKKISNKSTLKKKGESALVALGHDYEGLEGCTMSRFGGSLLNPELDRFM